MSSLAERGGAQTKRGEGLMPTGLRYLFQNKDPFFFVRFHPDNPENVISTTLIIVIDLYITYA